MDVLEQQNAKNFVEGNGYEARQKSKEQKKIDAKIYVGRSTTVRNLMFCAHTHYYVTMHELRNQNVSIG